MGKRRKLFPGQLVHKLPIGRPVIYPNGRVTLRVMVDLEEARQIREFCNRQLLDVTRFLRKAALEMLKMQGLEVKEYAVDVNRKNVDNLVKFHKRPKPYPVTPDEEEKPLNTNNKINPYLASWIRERYFNGNTRITQVELAKVFEISQAAISLILTNEMYAGYEEEGEEGGT